jgi:hypothetical protein
MVPLFTNVGIAPTVKDEVTVDPPLSVYVIVTVPAFKPVTIPFASMLAIDELLEDQALAGLVGGMPQELHERRVELPRQTVLFPWID